MRMHRNRLRNESTRATSRCAIVVRASLAAVARPRRSATRAPPPPPHRRRCRATRSRRRRRSTCPGFPLPYRQGYADGCASATGAERKDAARFARRSELPHRLAGRNRALPQEVAAPCKPSTSHFVDVRGERHHVLTWGEPQSPPLVLLHGWMDVGASFQFLVDALARDWYAIAPDLRGFGRSAWQPQGYWFYDYLADLEALLERFVRDDPCASSATASAATSSMDYAGVRPAARAIASYRSKASAFPPKPPDDAPRKIAEMARCAGEPAALSTIRESRRRRRSAAEEESAPAARQGGVSRARMGARVARRSRGARTRIRATRCRFRTSIGSRNLSPIWRNVTAPVLWVAAAESEIPRWLARSSGRRSRRRRPR